MSQRNDIRSRIQSRKFSSYQKSLSISKRLYRYGTIVMLVVALGLLSLIVLRQPQLAAKIPYGPQILEKVEGVFSSSFFAKLLPFDGWFKKKPDVPVTASFPYIKTKQANVYTSEGNTANALYDGLVVYVGEEKDVYSVIVHHDNALYATYDNLEEVHVKLYDRIKQDSVLGTFEENIILEFQYKDVAITYEEAIKLE